MRLTRKKVPIINNHYYYHKGILFNVFLQNQLNFIYLNVKHNAFKSSN